MSDSDPILQRLSREGITALYHFTSVENLPSIKQARALCSKQTLENLGLWPPPEPGGNELSHGLDRANDNWDKVALNFTPHTPMVFRKKPEKHLCFCVLDVRCAALEGVFFTDTNATASVQGHRRGLGFEGLELINFGAIRSLPRPWDRDGWVRPVQAEVLIPDRLPLGFVREVTFVSESSRAEGRRLWGSDDHPPFNVSERIFADFSQSSAATHNYSFLKDCVLTDVAVDKSNCRTSFVGKSEFFRARSGTIWAVAKVHALAGARGEILWKPAQESSTTTFEKKAEYFHWCHISLGKLPDSRCSLEYRLGGVRWQTIEFDVR